MMADQPAKDPHPRAKSWAWKFGCAARGIKRAIRSDASFFVHLFATALVVAAGVVLGVDRVEWCVLLLCVGLVFVAETMNTAIEWLAKAVTDQYDTRVRDALDMGGGAVLWAAITAVVVGGIVLINRLGLLLAWWPAE